MDEFEELVMLDREQFGGSCKDDTQRAGTSPGTLATSSDDGPVTSPNDGPTPFPDDGPVTSPNDGPTPYPDDGLEPCTDYDSDTTEVCEWTDEHEKSTLEGDGKEEDHTGTGLNIDDYLKQEEEGDKNSGKKTPKEKIRKLKCVCKVSCIDLFDKETVTTHILSMKEMQKNEKEMYIMVSLQKVGNELTTRYGKRKRVRYLFKFDGKPVCRKTFCYLYDVGHKTLRGIQEHMNKNGIMPRIHGNTGRKPKNALKYAEVRHCVDFVVRYADQHGLSMPYAPLVEDEDPPIYLPSSLTKIKLHKAYRVTCEEAEVRALNITSFKDVWKHYVPHIRISNPKDDIHLKSEVTKKPVPNAVSEKFDKLEAANSLPTHMEV